MRGTFRAGVFLQPDATLLPPVLPRTARGSPTAISELCAAFPPGQTVPLRARARGLFGAGRGFALSQLSLASGRPLVCVVADEEAAEDFRKRIALPLSRYGTPEDIGAATVFLASRASGWITGQCLYVTGGS